MPRMDGTGPAGAGRMTGRGLGPCGNKEDTTASEFYGHGMGSRRGMRSGRGMHMGCGCGLGFGRGVVPGYGYLWNASAPMDDEARKTLLQEQRAFLKAHTDTIDKRLETL